MPGDPALIQKTPTDFPFLRYHKGALSTSLGEEGSQRKSQTLFTPGLPVLRAVCSHLR